MPDTETEAVETSPVSRVQRGRLRSDTALWVAILIVYTLLLAGTGYVAFFYYEDNPAVNVAPEWLNRFTDQETRAQILDALRDDSQIFKRKRDLATQSFNVVLGALLGFLSASAVSATRKEKP